jgi:diguanylate cyclase (GGDEF)-like protein
MTLLLDARTMVFIYVGIRIGQAVMLAHLWRAQRNYPPARDWAVGALMSAAGLLCLALRGMSPGWVSEIVANSLLLPGWMIFDYGIARAAGRKPSVKLGLALCALVIGSLAWYSFVSPNRPARILTHHLALVIFDLYAAHACLTVSKASQTLTFRLIAALLIVFAMTCLWRVADEVFGLTLAFSPLTPRIQLLATSIIIFPMITMLLALQTSQRLQDEINDLAGRDMLTGAFNRRAFDELVKREWSRAVRHGHPISFLVVDIDHFKKFNDQHGHQTGDATLVEVSNSAQAALRANDIWCRHGGEEFVALLPDTTIAQAMAVAERLRSSVEKTSIATPGGSLKVSVSIGVAQRSATQSHWSEVLATSDAALYKAKAAGRNKVIAA